MPLIPPVVARTWLAGTSTAPRELVDAIESKLADVDLDGRDPLFCRFAAATLIRKQVQGEGHDPDAPDLAEHLSDAADHALAEVIPGRLAEILDMAAAHAAAAEANIARIRGDEQTRRSVDSAADEIRYRLDTADAVRRGALLDAGELTATAQRIRSERGDIGVDVSALADRTGASRPTLYKYAEQVSSDETAGALTTLSTAALARLHLGYGGGDEGVESELHARLPRLAGWYNAATWLKQQHDDAWRAERGGFDPMDTKNPPRLPAYGQMMRQYRAMVEEIASGPLGDHAAA